MAVSHFKSYLYGLPKLQDPFHVPRERLVPLTLVAGLLTAPQPVEMQAVVVENDRAGRAWINERIRRADLCGVQLPDWGLLPMTMLVRTHMQFLPSLAPLPAIYEEVWNPIENGVAIESSMAVLGPDDTAYRSYLEANTLLRGLPKPLIPDGECFVLTIQAMEPLNA